LKARLYDPAVDVSWNAALALAQLGDDSGRVQLLQMLDRSYLERVPDMNEEQRIEATLNALKAAVLLADSEMGARLQDISRSDENLKVRQAAFEAIAEWERRRAGVPTP
jgi:hypothetical protein